MARSVAAHTNIKVWEGLQLKNSENVFIVVGKTSDWTSEPVAEDANPDLLAIPEPVVALRPYLSTMCVEVTESEYNALDISSRIALPMGGSTLYYEYISDEDAYTRGATNVLFSTEYNPSLGHPEPTTYSFRAYYGVKGLTPSAGYESDTYLEPGHIEDYGMIFYINHGRAIPILTAEFSTHLHVLKENR